MANEEVRPYIKECAVVAVPSEKWGQKVASVVVLSAQGKTAGKDGKAWSPLDMRRAMKERLVPYKIPQEMKVVDIIPRNAMGKSESPQENYVTSYCANYLCSQQKAAGTRNVAK